MSSRKRDLSLQKGIGEYRYLTDVISRIVNSYPNSRLDEPPAMGL
jgi:hypothetical protein